MSLQTEYDFILPKGYTDEEGRIHRQGKMRLARAADEIMPLKDPRVRDNPDYFMVLVLSRVITRLGDLQVLDTKVIEKLYTGDFKYLQNMYQIINEDEEAQTSVTCPYCGKSFTQ